MDPEWLSRSNFILLPEYACQKNPNKKIFEVAQGKTADGLSPVFGVEPLIRSTNLP